LLDLALEPNSKWVVDGGRSSRKGCGAEPRNEDEMLGQSPPMLLL